MSSICFMVYPRIFVQMITVLIIVCKRYTSDLKNINISCIYFAKAVAIAYPSHLMVSYCRTQQAVMRIG